MIVISFISALIGFLFGAIMSNNSRFSAYEEGYRDGRDVRR